MMYPGMPKVRELPIRTRAMSIVARPLCSGNAESLPAQRKGR
jgi:hypothetical protein